MALGLEGLCFDQLHIDVARNTTDDFNPFHDPRRWQLIRENPFGSPIVLGFQTAFLISDRVEALHRGKHGVPGSDAFPLAFSNYEFRFVGALRPGEVFDVQLRKTVDKIASGGGIATRALIRKQSGEPVLMGSVSETSTPKFLTDAKPTGLPRLAELADRQPVPDSNYFLKRKYLTTSNGKNFVLAGLAAQQDYFDELAEQIAFPPLFTVALASCALLEKGWQSGYDFHADPVVYTTHQISVDRRLQASLRSNDRLHLLVDGPLRVPDDRTSEPPAGSQTYHVFGLIADNAVLFRARMQLANLHSH